MQLLLTAALLLPACGGGADTAKADKAAALAKKIKSAPDDAESILKEAGMTPDQFEALMREVAGDPELSAAYTKAMGG